jgi:hypothetical protein
MQPSETDRGHKWLSNFKDEDQPAARLLLDSLEFVGQDQLRNGLLQLIESLAEKLPSPIALIPARELEATQSYYSLKNRDAKPSLLLPNSFPGSEAIIANIAQSLRKQQRNKGPFVASPSLRNMRSAKARAVLYIDDFSGSGKRITKFHEAYRRHPTIKSWESYKLISYHVAYAMTPTAHDRLSKLFGSDNIHVARICPTFSTQNWTSEEHENVERVCREYTCWGKQGYELGYDKSRGLLVFSHSAPNNLPAILWQLDARTSAHWSPLFPDRSVPSDLSPLFEESTYGARLTSSLHRLAQTRLARGDWRDEASPELKNVLLVLAAMARRPQNYVRIAELTRLSYREISAIVESCRGWHLVGTMGLRLTDEGLAELRHAKGISLTDEKATLKGSTEFYYPRSLRVGC